MIEGSDVIGNKALTDEECTRLEETLGHFHEQDGMNLETLDGFFAALHCGPELVMPSEFLEEVFGGEIDESFFAAKEDLQDFLNLIFRHWNAASERLQSREVFVPFLAQDDQGVERANDWAKGFVRGMLLRKESWKELLDDEENDGLLVPIFALAHENDPDPKMRPYKEPMTQERRDQLIACLVGSVMMIYRYFEPQRRMQARESREHATHRREAPKIGRNDPCYCGSGKKYKKCCGNITVQ